MVVPGVGVGMIVVVSRVVVTIVCVIMARVIVIVVTGGCRRRLGRLGRRLAAAPSRHADREQTSYGQLCLKHRLSPPEQESKS
jgi:hypothetical protein